MGKKPSSSIIRKEFPRVVQEYYQGRWRYRVEDRAFLSKKSATIYRDKDKALQYAKDLAKRRDLHGKTGIKDVSVELLNMAREGEALLKPWKKTILDACRFFHNHLMEQHHLKHALKVEVLAQQFLKTKLESKIKPLSEHTKKELVKMTDYLIQRFEKISVSMIQKKHIEEYLNRLNVSTQTKKNRLMKFSQFFSWCKEEGHIQVNPCAKIDIHVWKNDIQRYTAWEAEKMLRVAEEKYPELIPYISMLFFLGIRPLECEHLERRHINLETREVTIPKTTPTKADRTRYVPMEDNIYQWLQVYLKDEDGKITPINFQKKLKAWKADCGFKINGLNPSGKQFIPDGLRHTFASMFYAKHQNMPMLNARMGNSSSVAVNFYLRGVPKKECEYYWNISPSRFPPNKKGNKTCP